MDKISAHIEHPREGVSWNFDLIPVFIIGNALAQILGQTSTEGTIQIECSLQGIVLLIQIIIARY